MINNSFPKETLFSYRIFSKYRSALMGLAILSTIIFHYTEDCKLYSVYFSGWIQKFYLYVGSSGVDIFIFLSGLGLYFSWKKSPARKTFYRKRFMKVLPPYFLIAIPVWIWYDFFYKYKGAIQFTKDLLFISFFTEGQKWFWYILLCGICYLCFPYIYQVIETASDRIAEHMRMISLFSFITVVAILLQLYCTDLFNNINIAFLRFPVFFIGCFVGRSAWEERKIPRAVYVSAVLSFFLLLIDRKNIIISRYTLAFFNLHLCLLLLFVFEKIQTNIIIPKTLKVLDYFGKYSLELYLAHVAVRRIMKTLGYRTCYPRYEICMVIISVVLAVLIKQLINALTEYAVQRSKKMRFYKDLKKYFHYTLFAAKSQLRSEVTNSYLDWLWWILEPFCNMIVYTIIFGYVFNIREPFFPIFIFIGVSMWGFFSRTLNASVKLIKNNKSIVTKVYIPKQMLLIKTMLVNAFKMMLSFFIIFIMMLLFQVKISINVVYAIPTLLIWFLLTYGISCFLMHYGVFVEDLAYIVSILLNMLMYFTGIFYSIEKRVPAPYGSILNTFNPMAYLITVMRNALLYQENASAVPLLIWFVIAIVLASLGTKLIYKNENSYVKVI